MIRSFRDRRTAALFVGRYGKGIDRSLAQRGQAKLFQLDAAPSLETFRSIPGASLERLSGNRSGQWSIRVNRQWRICFRWLDGDAHDVELVDYH